MIDKVSSETETCQTKPAGVVSRTYRGRDGAARKAARTEQLVLAAIEVIGTVGFIATSVQGICRQAKLTERYFYENFDNREAALMAAFERVCDDFGVLLESTSGRIELGPAEQAQNITTIFYGFLSQHRAAGRVLLIEGFGASAAGDIVRLRRLNDLAQLLIDLLRPGTIAHDPARASALASAMVGSLIFTGYRWAINGYAPEPAVMIDLTKVVMLAIAGCDI